jgi:hypothetical protein
MEGEPMATFIVMTWNAENLFHPEPGSEEAEQESYRRKLRLLADVIGRLESDVVALQEVGGEGPLQDLQEALGGAYAHHAVSAFPDGRGPGAEDPGKETLLPHPRRARGAARPDPRLGGVLSCRRRSPSAPGG